MSSIEEIQLALEHAKISLAVDGESLVVNAPKGALTAELRDALRLHKSAMIEALRTGSFGPQRQEWSREAVVPPNRIMPGSVVLTPDMLPLIDLSAEELDRVVGQAAGGVSNIQDIYGLTPLQQGILFHHRLSERGDPYIQVGRLWFRDGALRDRYIAAVARVVERHDILRSAFVWEGLREPAQLVLRRVAPAVTEIIADPAGGPVAQQLADRFDPRHYRMDLAAPPLLRLAHATDPATGRCEMLLLIHHLVDDISSIRILTDEILAIMTGEGGRLLPAEPFRRLIAQVRLGKTAEQHERFFRTMLGDVEAPSVPYGLSELHGDGGEITELQRRLPFALNARLRAQARRLGVSLGSLCHLAWGQVVARLTGQDAVVFGTILFGRMQAGAGADRIMGPFINTLPFRLDIDATSAEESVRRTHARLAELLGHEHAPLSLAQRCAALPSGSPLFTTLLNYRHKINVPADGDVASEPESSDYGWQGLTERTLYPITVSVDDYGHALGLSVQVAASLSAARLFGYVQQALASLADALERAPGTAVRALEVLPAEERRLLLDGWNQTAHPFPDTLRLHQLFEQQVAATPDAAAVRIGEQTLSYAAFNRRANRLAHHLIARGVRPDSRVGVCAERGLPMVEALFAVLKAGGAYLPLDPGYPAERLAYMLEDAKPELVLCDAAGRAALAPSGCPVLELELDAAEWQDAPDHDPDPDTLGLTARHLAYVIYTSGSTGRPKGVGNEHRALVNRILWMQRATPIGVGDAVLQKTPFGFDVSVWEFFWTLATGATLVVAPPDTHKDPFALATLIRDNAITTLHFVPSMLTAFLGSADAARCTTLRQVICSGEALPPATLDRCRTLLPAARVHNLYGPTEAAIDVTSWTAPQGAPQAGEAGTTNLVPIGRPISNLRIYLLDAHRRPVPLGAAGELYIGGVGVARGYHNRPELTAERFLPDPFVSASAEPGAPEPGAMLYRTGDLARYAEDGEILYLGRNDHQIKLRGLRIELGEIEAALAALPEIGEAIVMARPDSAGETRLIAYVVTRNDGDDPDQHDPNWHDPNWHDPAARIARWRTALGTTLPDHMVPAAYVTLDAMPLTANGKLDRKALPEPGSDSFGRARHVPPEGPVETTLAAIWQTLLGVETIGRNDHFFELGGHSLLAVQLMEQLRQAGLSVPIGRIFDTPVLHRLAATVGAWRGIVVPANRITVDASAITPDMLPLVDLSQADIDRIVAHTPGGMSNIQDILALTPLQEGMLFQHLLGGPGDSFLQVGEISFANRALLDRYLTAMQTVVDRHDILRTDIVFDQISTPAQVVRRHAALHISTHDFDPGDGAVAAQLARRFDPAQTRINLGDAPLLHLAVAHDPEIGRWHMLLLLHHIIDDITSLAILTKEVQALATDPKTLLLEPPPFRNLVAQIRLGTSIEEHKAYFQSELSHVKTPTLPLGLAGIAGDPGEISESHVMLPAHLSQQLRAQARRLGVSLASLCHHAWAQVLAQLTGRVEVVFGTLLAGRMGAGPYADRAMGPFINVLPIRLEIDKDGVERNVRRTHAKFADLLRHEHASLAMAQRCAAIPPGTPLFNSLLNYRHNALRSAETSSPDDPVLWTRFEERTSYPIALHIDDFGDDLRLVPQIVGPHEPDQVAAYMQQALTSLAHALERAPKTPALVLATLPADERLRFHSASGAESRPEKARMTVTGADAPTRRTEAILAPIWDELLGTTEETHAGTFFEGGGDSLMSVRLRGRAAAQGIRLSISDIVEARSLSELAACGTALSTEAEGGQAMSSLKTRIPLERAPEDLVCLHRSSGVRPTILFIPGAGSSVTDFMPFVQALDHDRTCLGLQHRGFNGSAAPARSVREAADHAMARLEQAEINGALHVVGHSYGGWIAFELARRSQPRPWKVVSVTLLDTEAPDASAQDPARRSDRDTLRAYVRTHERVSGLTSSPVDNSMFDEGSTEAVLEALHRALVKAGVLPGRSRPDLLNAPYATFAAAYRDSYTPEAGWDGTLLLALVGGSAGTAAMSGSRKAAGWRPWVAAMNAWTGPGSHYSMLRRPYVKDLTQWWSREVRDCERLMPVRL